MPNIAAAIRKEVGRLRARAARLQKSTQAEVASLQARAEKLIGALAALGSSAGRGRKRAAAKGRKGAARAKRGSNIEAVKQALRSGVLSVKEIASKTGMALPNLRFTLFSLKRKGDIASKGAGKYALKGARKA